MSNYELQKLVELVSNLYFKRPFNHKALFNSRLRTTGGRYYLTTHNIEINPKMLANFGKTTLIGIIKHELCHYHLHLLGYGGKHQSKHFKRLLKKVGGLRYAPRLATVNMYIYQCGKCKKRYFRQRMINTKKYVCGECHSKVKLIRRK